MVTPAVDFSGGACKNTNLMPYCLVSAIITIFARIVSHEYLVQV